jgi:GNAT superfamily N-acetyltransferase
MIQLREMNAEDFAKFTKRGTKNYAKNLRTSENFSPSLALKIARHKLSQNLPNGPDTPGHFLFCVESQVHHKTIGHLWYAVKRQNGKPYVFLYDIFVKKTFRRQGIAKKVLSWLEERAPEHGADTIRLQVFAHNKLAKKLYEKIGYRAVLSTLHKSVSFGNQVP